MVEKSNVSEVNVQCITARRDFPVFGGDKGDREKEWVKKIESHLVAIKSLPSSREVGIPEGTHRWRNIKAEGMLENIGWDKIVGLILDYHKLNLNKNNCYL